MTTQLTIEQEIEATRKALDEARAPVLVETDEGTHGGPRTYNVYRALDGTLSGQSDFAGVVTSVSVAAARAKTAGRMRHIGGHAPDSDRRAKVETLARQLESLETQAAADRHEAIRTAALAAAEAWAPGRVAVWQGNDGRWYAGRWDAPYIPGGGTAAETRPVVVSDGRRFEGDALQYTARLA